MEYNIQDILANIFKDDDPKKISLKDKMELVTKEIDKYKCDVKNYVTQSEYNIQGLEEECKKLCEESNILIKEMQLCQREIEEETFVKIKHCSIKDQEIKDEYNNLSYRHGIVSHLVRALNHLNMFDEMKRTNRLSAATDNLVELLQYLQTPLEGFQKLSMFESLKTTSENQHEVFVDFLDKKWNEHFSWKCELLENRHNQIDIFLDLPNTIETRELLGSLAKLGLLNEKISSFSSFLYHEVLVPIIKSECTVIPRENKILITVPLGKKNKPTYEAVIANTRSVILFLSDRLYPLTHTSEHTVMDLLGHKIGAEYAIFIMNECFVDTIPRTMEGLANYHVITTEIEEFQYFLMQARFMNSDLSILSYTDNLETLFADKCCEHLLERARDIIFKDLSLSMSIGVESLPEEAGESVEVLDQLSAVSRRLPASLFYFPRCMVSRSAQELLDLLYETMECAVECSDLLLQRLYCASRLVIELFDAIMPTKHEYYLQNIPQYVALFHNNCMYLAHNLQTFGEKWNRQLTNRRLPFPINYVDLVLKLRELAYTYLTKMLQNQRRQILDNIRSSDLNCLSSKDVLGESAELAVRQCLRQLQLLKNVWIGVFPVNVFTRLMGTLMNLLVEELTHRVCCVEDISLSVTTQLVDMYTLVVNKAPGHFQNEGDIEKNVKSWVKFQELILVLGGSLKDIEQRWGEGAGPLAIHFRSQEIRSLIKALFQNTHFRANLLAKIK